MADERLSCCWRSIIETSFEALTFSQAAISLRAFLNSSSRHTLVLRPLINSVLLTIRDFIGVRDSDFKGLPMLRLELAGLLITLSSDREQSKWPNPSNTDYL